MSTTRDILFAFVSKSPSKTERDWSTMDKKAFATCFALMKLEYLLRDIDFVLRYTSHGSRKSNLHQPWLQRSGETIEARNPRALILSIFQGLRTKWRRKRSPA